MDCSPCHGVAAAYVCIDKICMFVLCKYRIPEIMSSAGNSVDTLMSLFKVLEL